MSHILAFVQARALNAQTVYTALTPARKITTEVQKQNSFHHGRIAADFDTLQPGALWQCRLQSRRF